MIEEMIRLEGIKRMKNEMGENTAAETKNDMRHRGAKNGREIGENLDKRQGRQGTCRLRNMPNRKWR